MTDKSTHQIMEENLYPHHLMDLVVINFIKAYLETRNCGDASRAVGIRVSSGNKLLNSPDIQTCIKSCVAQWARLNNFDSSEVLERTNEISGLDPLDVFEDNGNIKNLKDMPAHVRRAIKKIKYRETWDMDLNGMKIVTGQVVDVEF